MIFETKSVMIVEESTTHNWLATHLQKAAQKDAASKCLPLDMQESVDTLARQHFLVALVNNPFDGSHLRAPHPVHLFSFS